MNTTNTKNTAKEYSPLKPAAQKKHFVNIEYLKEISDGNSEFVHAMLHAFKQESTLFLIQLENQLSAGDYFSIAKTAHRMKPAGTYIGASSLTLLISSLEQAAKNVNQDKTVTLVSQTKTMVTAILKEIEKHL